MKLSRIHSEYFFMPETIFKNRGHQSYNSNNFGKCKNDSPHITAARDLQNESQAIDDCLPHDNRKQDEISAIPDISSIDPHSKIAVQNPPSFLNTADHCSQDKGKVENNNTLNKDNLEILLEDEKFQSIINSRAQKSPAEVLLAALKFALSNYLPISSMENLLKLINLIFNNPILDDSRYKLDQLFNNKVPVEFHAQCLNCYRYLGEMSEIKNLTKCTNVKCETPLNLSNASSLNYFIIIDPSIAIQDLLEQFEDHYHHVMHERVTEENHIKDIIIDGALYKEFVSKLSPTDRKQYVTAVFNTDGAPKFECSNYSIWPIHMMVNEIPMENRQPFLCGLWYGRHKPGMIPYLGPFVTKMNKLSSEGIPCKIKGENLKVKLFAICSCVDTVARAPMQGIKQFNGFHGYNWCLHPGDNHNSTRTMQYPYLNPAPLSRTKNSTIESMRKLVNNNSSEDGILSVSHLINLRGYDIIWGFVIDYMHQLVGVAEQFTELITSELTNDDKTKIDSMILNIQVPNQIVRLTRAFTDRQHWKAREWENWILYYSLPIFIQFETISKKKILHWCKLVQILHILLSTDIKINDLEKADKLAHEFVATIEEIYKSKDPLTYNVHQLLHLVQSVLDWGPLWAHSGFLFEAGNRYALQIIKCSKGAIQQVARIINLQYGVSRLEKKLYPDTWQVKEYCKNLEKAKVSKMFKIAGKTYFGKLIMLKEDLMPQFHLKHSKVYHKMVKNRCLYTTTRKDNDRSCNFYAQLCNGTFIKIEKFIIEIESQKEYVLCKVLDTQSLLHCRNMNVIKGTSVLKLRKTEHIVTVCVPVQIEKQSFIFPVPNPYYY